MIADHRAAVFAMQNMFRRCPSARYLLSELLARVSKIPGAFERNEERWRLFESCIVTGSFDDGLAVSGSFRHAYDQVRAIAELVQRLGAVRPREESLALLMKALGLAACLDDPEGRSAALAEIAKAYADLDAEKQWRGVVEAIGIPAYRLEPLGSMAARSLAAGRHRRTEELLTELEALARGTIEGSAAGGAVSSLETEVAVYLRLGRHREALETLDSMPEGTVRDRSTLELVAALIKSGRPETALGPALQACGVWTRARALTQLAAAHLDVGNPGPALEALRLAAQLSSAAGPASREEGVWAGDLIELLAKAGLYENARELIRQIETASDLARYYKAQALLRLVGRSIETTGGTLAQEAIEAALRVARSDPYPTESVRSFAEIAAHSQLLGKSEVATSLLRHLVDVAVASGRPRLRIQVLERIAIAYDAAGQSFSAEAVGLLRTLTPVPADRTAET
jgi:tetratricopeptide (TPR) repeat protein